MIVVDIFWLADGRPVAAVVNDCDRLPVGGRSTLHRVSDGAAWPIDAIEEIDTPEAHPRGLSHYGHTIGLVLPVGAAIRVGDGVVLTTPPDAWA